VIGSLKVAWLYLTFLKPRWGEKSDDEERRSLTAQNFAIEGGGVALGPPGVREALSEP